MTEAIEPAPDRIDQRQLAQQLVEAADLLQSVARSVAPGGAAK
jgi:hypothetical protein